jgi:hypothetical protein
MAMVAVTTDIIINLPKEKVAEFAANPDNVPQWYINIRSVQWQTPRPLKTGSQLLFSGRFLGRLLQNLYEVVEFIPGQKMVLRASNTPFGMETVIGWQAIDENTTRMTIRNRSIPRGLAKLFTPLMALALRWVNHKDLRLLKQLLEKRVRVMQPI